MLKSKLQKITTETRTLLVFVGIAFAVASLVRHRLPFSIRLNQCVGQVPGTGVEVSATPPGRDSARVAASLSDSFDQAQEPGR